MLGKGNDGKRQHAGKSDHDQKDRPSAGSIRRAQTMGQVPVGTVGHGQRRLLNRRGRLASGPIFERSAAVLAMSQLQQMSPSLAANSASGTASAAMAEREAQAFRASAKST